MQQTMKRTDQVEYFDQFPKDVQAMVQDLLEETIRGVPVDTFGSNDAEPIECKRRDGFIPHSWNRGGLMIREFTDLSMFWSSGSSVSHEAAQKEIERQIEYSLNMAKETFYERNQSELESLGFTDQDDARLNYHDLYELKRGDLAEELSELESEYMSDESSSIMFEVRFMFHGVDDDEGQFSASVSCAVNTEGPYHRQSISWAKDVFCEGSKEVSIYWTTPEELKRELTKALKKVSEAIF